MNKLFISMVSTFSFFSFSLPVCSMDAPPEETITFRNKIQQQTKEHLNDKKKTNEGFKGLLAAAREARIEDNFWTRKRENDTKLLNLHKLALDGTAIFEREITKKLIKITENNPEQPAPIVISPETITNATQEEIIRLALQFGYKPEDFTDATPEDFDYVKEDLISKQEKPQKLRLHLTLIDQIVQDEIKTMEINYAHEDKIFFEGQ